MDYEGYERVYGDPYRSAAHMALDLMRGDRESFQMGYSFASALNFACELAGIESIIQVAIVAEVLSDIVQGVDLYNSPTRIPQWQPVAV